MAQERWKNILLGGAIAVVFVLLTVVGLSTFYPEPKYNQLCGEPRPYAGQEILELDRETCEAQDGVWQENSRVKPVPAQIPGEPPEEVNKEQQGWCDLYAKCRAEYGQARDDYNRNIFVVMTALGSLAVLVGILARLPFPVAAGFAFGGVVNILIGTARWWGDMNEYIRFGVLLIVLIILVWVAFKYFREK